MTLQEELAKAIEDRNWDEAKKIADLLTSLKNLNVAAPTPSKSARMSSRVHPTEGVSSWIEPEHSVLGGVPL